MIDTLPSSAISIRVQHIPQSRYAGQRRHDLRIGPQPRYVDATRTDRNRVIFEPPAPAWMRSRSEELRAQGGPRRRMRSSAAVATSAIITFGIAAQEIFESLCPDAQDAAYLAVAERIAAEYGTTVRGLVVHADETAPHAHVVWDCRDAQGVAMSKLMKGSRLQDIAAEVIADHAPGIVRGVRKADRLERGDHASEVYHRSVRELHRDLPAELEERRAEVMAAEGRVVEMEARVAKARTAAKGEDEKAAKAAKRLATYEKRLADRQEELATAEGRFRELDQVRNHLERQAAQIEAEKAAVEEQRADVERREAGLAKRTAEAARREAAVTAREGLVAEKITALQRLYRAITGMIGAAADRLGVAPQLRGIRDAIEAEGLAPDEPDTADEDMSPSM